MTPTPNAISEARERKMPTDSNTGSPMSDGKLQIPHWCTKRLTQFFLDRGTGSVVLNIKDGEIKKVSVEQYLVDPR